MKPVISKLVLASLVLATIFAMGRLAWAKDAAVAAVTAPGAIVIQNGNHYAQGTNAIGTIQLFYTVVANQFAAGTFGSFTLDLSIKQGKANPATKYPLSLNLRQTGSANLILDPAIDSFLVGSSAFGGSTTVNINIPASVASDPAFQVDGAELVANLQLEVPGQRFLDTVTTIQVHLVLMHPSDADCLIVRNFITDNAIAGEVNPLSVSKSSGSGNVSSVPNNPHYIVVAANTCSLDQCIDARFTLNSNFELKGTQAVKTFSSNSIIDEFLEATTFFGTSPTPTGDPNNDIGMCVTLAITPNCLSIPAGESFLLRADFGIKTNASFPPPSQYTGFSANVLDGGSTGNCTVAGTLHSLADPNPVSVTLNALCVDGAGKVSCTP